MAGFKTILKRATPTDEQLTESRNTSNKGKNSSKFSFSKSSLQLVNPLKSLGARLFLIIITAMLLCVGFVGINSMNQAEQLVESNLSQAGEETVKQVGRNLDSALKTYEDITLQLMLSEDIISNMKSYLTTTDPYENMIAYQNLSSNLTTFIFSNDLIENIAIIPQASEKRALISGALSNTTDLQKTNSEFYAEEWFKQTVANSGAVNWVSPQPNGIIDNKPNDKVAIARLVRNNSEELSYVIAIELKINTIFSAAYDVQIVEGTHISIVDSGNNYVLSEDINLVGQAASIKLDEQQLQQNNGVVTAKDTEGHSYLTLHRSLENNNYWHIVAAIPMEGIEEQSQPIRDATVIILILAAIISFVVGIWIMFLVSRPLAIISALMMRGAKGDLTVRSPHMKRQDEIGMLGKNFDEMMQQIEKLAKQTTDSASEVLKTASELTNVSDKTAIAAKEISIATDEIASGASSLAMEAEKGADLTGQINKQMQQLNTYNEQMKQSAFEVENASMQGTAYMAGLIEKTGATEQMISAMVEKVNDLSTSTSSIVKILDVMNNVTKQTNILSLNATIEAARAGAAGKGFMVVADEIRQLAEQSKNSIEVVGQITNAILQEIGETVKVLSEAQPLFQEQIMSVKEANLLFVSVQSQMEQFKQNMQQVTNSFYILNDSQDTLSQAMNNVSAVAEESSATSEEVASLSTEQLSISERLVDLSAKLESVSNQLQSQLQKFKID